jgi:hypothetical protein
VQAAQPAPQLGSPKLPGTSKRRAGLTQALHGAGARAGLCWPALSSPIPSLLRSRRAPAVWSAETLELVRVLRGHRGSVLCLLSVGTVLLSGARDNMIRVWDLDMDFMCRCAPGGAGEGG